MANFHYVLTDRFTELVAINFDLIEMALPRENVWDFQHRDTNIIGPALELYTDPDFCWIVNMTMDQFLSLANKSEPL